MRGGQREREILGKIYEIWTSGDEVLELEMGKKGEYIENECVLTRKR